ncbi:MAG: TAXI family TRAP transporter solute-binding subunit [Rhodobacteraceae bacterium]|nr:TAXI family TRAP transporter solute-binding subunit [Paracoccaceae bacterium]
MLKRTLLAAVAAGLMSAHGALAQAPIAISVLPTGAINNAQAQAMARVIQENAGVQVRLLTFNASSAIMGAANSNQAEFAFISNAEAGPAVRGQEAYEGAPMERLQMAATILPLVVGVFVRKDSGIETVDELRGRRFPTGWQGFPHGLYLSNALLATAGLSLDDVDGVPVSNLLRAADDVAQGRTVGSMFSVGAPKVAEVDSAVGGVRFLSLDDSPEALARMQSVRPEYHITRIEPAGHLVGVEGPTNMMRYFMVLLVNEGTPEDVVYNTVKALHENKPGLVSGHPSFGPMNFDDMAMQHPGIEHHPGAIRYFREAGLWQD